MNGTNDDYAPGADVAALWVPGTDELAPRHDPIEDLDHLLSLLARRGWWISAWYPLTSRSAFECRIAHGVTPMEWAIEEHAVDALRAAMSKAGLG